MTNTFELQLIAAATSPDCLVSRRRATEPAMSMQAGPEDPLLVGSYDMSLKAGELQ